MDSLLVAPSSIELGRDFVRRRVAEPVQDGIDFMLSDGGRGAPSMPPRRQVSIYAAAAYPTPHAANADGEPAADGLVAAFSGLVGIDHASTPFDRTVRDLDEGGQVLWIKRAKTKRGNRKVKVPEPARTWLLRLAHGRQADEYLVPGAVDRSPRSTSWLRKEVARICRAAGVTVVCTHGLRGTHSTIAEEAGVTPDAVAASLGHTDPATTGRYYTLPDARQGAQQQRFLKVVAGSRSGQRIDPRSSSHS